MTRLRFRIERSRRNAGFALSELVVVMAILSIVLGGLTAVFVAGLNAEVDLTRRVSAQIETRLAIGYLRRETHCASALPSSASDRVTLTLPTGCPTGSGPVTWCMEGSGQRWALYRKAGSTCDATGKQFADYITTNAVFAYYPPNSFSLGKLHVDFPVDLKPSDTQAAYRLVDDLVLRNTTRT
jgi:prepilin-type N-terminal cleavage/methylation domain-containing protein